MTYSDYVTDAGFAKQYLDYQERYRDVPKESDVKLAEAVTFFAPQSGAVLDVGCSTGNFLHYLHRLRPDLQLSGVDLMSAAIDKCRNDPALTEIDFHVGDVTRLTTERFVQLPLDDTRFHVVVVNALLSLLDEELTLTALRRIHERLLPGGWLAGFEYCNEYEQDLVITERDPDIHPDGVTLYFHSWKTWDRLLCDAGFKPSRRIGFTTVSALTPPFPSLETRTVDCIDGRRLMMRGIINQPWAHFAARKEG